MILFPSLEAPTHRLQQAKVKHVPIPLNGWSTRDKYVGSFSKEALRYCPFTYNWMWVDGRLTVRPGYSQHATGMTDPVESLFEYASVGGTRTIFAATNGGAGSCRIWNATSAGAASSVTAGLQGARWQHTMFATTSAVYLIIANGADSVRAYDGTTWTTPAITGVTSATLDHVCAHKGRLWFVEEATLSAWYLSAFAIAGTATRFDIGPFCKRGGHLMAIASWSRDGGSGPDDLIVFITSEGELVIYAGLDPNTVGEWTLVGIFNCDKPVGKRCWTKFGADLAIFTESGPVLISQVMVEIEPRDHLSDPIRDEFIAAMASARAFHGWEIINYTRRGWLWCNIPRTPGSNDQFVFNHLMMAWFPFIGMDANCWVQSGNALYFGGTGATYSWDTGQVDDDGAEVVADVSFNWWNYGSGVKKLFTLMRPHFHTNGVVNPLYELRVEFDEAIPLAQAEPTAATASEGTAWDDGFWDLTDWGSGSLRPVREWLTVEGEGTVGAPRIKVATISAEVSLVAVDVAYIDGGII